MIQEYQDIAKISKRAAQVNNVQRIVHLSTIGAHLDREETGLIRGQHFAETILGDAAPNVLHLRCGFFLENYLGSLETIKGHGAIYLPLAGSSRYEFVSTSDIAENVVDVLTSTAWNGHQVVELHGSQTKSFDEVAADFSEALGLKISHVQVPPEAAVDAMVGMGMSTSYAQDLTKLITSIEAGILKSNLKRGDSNVRSCKIDPKTFAKNVIKPLL